MAAPRLTAEHSDKRVSVQQPVKVPALDAEDECAERDPVGMQNGAGFRTLPDGYVTVVSGDLYAVVAAAAAERRPLPGVLAH